MNHSFFLQVGYGAVDDGITVDLLHELCERLLATAMVARVHVELLDYDFLDLREERLLLLLHTMSELGTGRATTPPTHAFVESDEELATDSVELARFLESVGAA